MSYSHKDLPIVRRFEEFVLAFGDEFIRDWTHLRAGQVWSEQLQAMISEADVFQLFWSSNSMISDFVGQEWEYALTLSRPSFIRPVYWEEPMPERPEKDLPPEALKRLHFHRFDLNGAPTTDTIVASRADLPADSRPRWIMVTPRADFNGDVDMWGCVIGLAGLIIFLLIAWFFS